MGIDFFYHSAWGLFAHHRSPWHPRPVGQPRLPALVQQNLVVFMCFAKIWVWKRMKALTLFEIFAFHKNKTRQNRCVDASMRCCCCCVPCLDQAFLLRCSFLARSKMIKASKCRDKMWQKLIQTYFKCDTFWHISKMFKKAVTCHRSDAFWISTAVARLCSAGSSADPCAPLGFWSFSVRRNCQKLTRGLLCSFCLLDSILGLCLGLNHLQL